MAVEIERRFLVREDIRRLCRDGVRIVQGYLPSDGAHTLRVRLAGTQGTLTMKSRRQGRCREEVEYPIAAETAVELLLQRCDGGLVEKIRYRVCHDDLCWEVDVFEGENAGLVIAEVELNHPDQPVSMPGWVGTEVTHVAAYGNSSLARHPIRHWTRAA